MKIQLNGQDYHKIYSMAWIDLLHYSYLMPLNFVNATLFLSDAIELCEDNFRFRRLNPMVKIFTKSIQRFTRNKHTLSVLHVL